MELDSPRERENEWQQLKSCSISHGVKRFILFHQKQHPRELSSEHISQFLTYLAVDGHVAASTQNQALNALIFLYRQVLRIELPRRSARAAETKAAGGLDPRRD